MCLSVVAAEAGSLVLVRSKADGARADAIASDISPDGTEALRFEIRAGDCSPDDCEQDRERVELKSRTTERSGTRTIYRWSFYLPEDFDLIWPARQFVAQFHQEDGPPAMLFSLEPDGLKFESRFSRANGSALIVPLHALRGTWHQIEADITWSRGKGHVRIAHNGHVVVERDQPTMSRKRAYFKIGLYRAHLSRNLEASSKSQVMYVREIERTLLPRLHIR